MTSENEKDCTLGLTLGMWLLRIWLGFRSLLTGFEKYAGMKPVAKVVETDGGPNPYGLTDTAMEKAYSFDAYHGVPAALKDKFASEPLVPQFALNLYDTLLGPLLILLGITLLAGIATRVSLFAMGLVYTSLTFGLILIKQDSGVAWLGIHVLMVVFALCLEKHNRFTLLKKW